MDVADAVWNIPDGVSDVPIDILNVRHLVQDVSGDDLDVRDGVPHVPDRADDLLNVAWNIQNAVPNVRNDVLHVRNLVLNIQNAVLDIQDGDWNVLSLFADISDEILDKGNSIFSGGNIMAYKRRASQVIADAQERATNLKAIDPSLDLGGGLTVIAFEGEIASVQTALKAYNTLLAQADAAANELNALEKRLGTLSGRMLAGVGARFGKDSSEYEMAGGVRTSEIKRGGKKEEPEGGGA